MRPQVAGSLLALCAVGFASAACDYGGLPGLWDGLRYQLLDASCRLARHADGWPSLPAARDGDHILLIGDSFDRQTVQAAAPLAGREAEDYTPVAEDDGKPSKIGRNLQLRANAQYLGNLFIFGANNRGQYAEPAVAGAVDGMHNLTFDRICTDFRRYSPYRTDPAMIVLNSILWDVMQWYTEHGRKGWEEGDYNVPPGLSSRKRAKTIYQVFEHGPEGPQWQAALRRYEDDILSLIQQVRRCFPTTELLCWRTAPLPATDYRNRHFWLKPPLGLCVVDMDRMLQGRGNDGVWAPDGSHPADEVLREYVNVLLNILAQHKEQGASEGGQHAYASRDTWRQEQAKFSLRSHRPHKVT